LTPAFVEGHSHLLLHPYNEAQWEFQVAHEPLALRTARAVTTCARTLLAGFTTVANLGTEGAPTPTSGLRQAVEDGSWPGPRVLASTAPSWQPAPTIRRFVPEWNAPQGAEEADGRRIRSRVVSSQIGKAPTGSSSTRTIDGAGRGRAPDLHESNR